MKIRNFDLLRDVVSRFPNKNVLDAFIEMNEDELIEFFRSKKAKVIRTDKNNHCSECNYIFEVNEEGDDESGYVYCSGCLRSLLCCDDEFCDHDSEILEQEIYDTLDGFYKSSHNNANN